MHPVGLARAGWLRFFGEAIAVDAIAPLVAALGRQDRDLEAKRTITQYDFWNVDVAHDLKTVTTPEVIPVGKDARAHICS